MPDQTIEATHVENNDAAPHATPQMSKLIMDMGNMMITKNKRGIILLRRNIRRRLFRIRDAERTGQTVDPGIDDGLKAWMELQFQPGFSWYKLTAEKDDKGNDTGKKFISGGFTFDWDVSADEPLKVIIPMEWDGVFDKDTGIKICVPPAFTKQG